MSEKITGHVDTKTAGEMLGILPQTVTHHLRTGDLLGMRFGRWYVSEESIEHYKLTRRPAHRPSQNTKAEKPEYTPEAIE